MGEQEAIERLRWMATKSPERWPLINPEDLRALLTAYDNMEAVAEKLAGALAGWEAYGGHSDGGAHVHDCIAARALQAWKEWKGD